MENVSLWDQWDELIKLNPELKMVRTEKYWVSEGNEESTIVTKRYLSYLKTRVKIYQYLTYVLLFVVGMAFAHFFW